MQVSDATLTSVLCRYAGLVQGVLDDPERWVGRTALGTSSPASPGWTALSDAQRSRWWVTRIGVAAGLAAAAPRYAGALADRLPLQAGLGAAAAGLAVCAVAREHGRTSPEQWVPLLGTVLFDRELELPPPGSCAAAAGEAAEDASEDGTGDRADDPADPAHPADPAEQERRAGSVRTLWRLARTFAAVSSMFDERPRGSLFARGLAKVPIVGVAGGWFDERGAIHKAGEQTARLVTAARRT